MATLILLTISMNIGPTKLLKFDLTNAKYDSKRRLCEGYTGVDLDDDGKIKETMAADNDKNDDNEDS